MRHMAADDSAWMRCLRRLGCVIGWFALVGVSPLLSQAGRAAEPAGVHAIFKTTDRGQSWSRTDAGMPGNTRIDAFGAVITAVFDRLALRGRHHAPKLRTDRAVIRWQEGRSYQG